MRNKLITKIKVRLLSQRKQFDVYKQKFFDIDNWLNHNQAKLNYNNRDDSIKLKIISFADGGEAYVKKSKIFINQAVKTGWFSDVKIYSLVDIKNICDKYFPNSTNMVLNFIEENKSYGLGYWLWKPLIVFDALMASNEGDKIVYADIGCEFSNRGYKVMNRLNSILFEKDTIFFQMPFQESKWTSPNVISYIGSSKKDAASGQISATFFLLKNVNSTRVLIQKWCELAMCNKFNLLSGDSNIFQWCHFIEHRHDQSILSLLVKKYNHYYMCQIDHFSDELYANKLHSIYYAPIHTLRSLGETIVSE